MVGLRVVILLLFKLFFRVPRKMKVFFTGYSTSSFPWSRTKEGTEGFEKGFNLQQLVWENKKSMQFLDIYGYFPRNWFTFKQKGHLVWRKKWKDCFLCLTTLTIILKLKIMAKFMYQNRMMDVMKMDFRRHNLKHWSSSYFFF